MESVELLQKNVGDLTAERDQLKEKHQKLYKEHLDEIDLNASEITQLEEMNDMLKTSKIQLEGKQKAYSTKIEHELATYRETIAVKETDYQKCLNTIQQLESEISSKELTIKTYHSKILEHEQTIDTHKAESLKRLSEVSKQTEELKQEHNKLNLATDVQRIAVKENKDQLRRSHDYIEQLEAQLETQLTRSEPKEDAKGAIDVKLSINQTNGDKRNLGPGLFTNTHTDDDQLIFNVDLTSDTASQFSFKCNSLNTDNNDLMDTTVINI